MAFFSASRIELEEYEVMRNDNPLFGEYALEIEWGGTYVRYFV